MMPQMKNPVTDRRNLSHSQNFLRDSRFVADLLDRTDIGRDDLVVEIGPGTGVITRELSTRSGQVLAVEVDALLASRLRERFANTTNITVVEADFLAWELPAGTYKVFANIPFNMTADIVGKLLESDRSPSMAYLIMQDTAAERFIGGPMAKNTQVSILLQPWFEMVIVERISRRQFVPTPRVDAVLAAFKKRERPLVEFARRQAFRDFVVYGYNQWQPTILDAFRKVFSGQQRAIIERELRISASKPSDLVLGQWLSLFEVFILHVPDHRKALVQGADRRLREQQSRLSKLHRTR